MDKATVTQKLAPFVALGQQEGRPFTIVRLDDAIPGFVTGSYIVRLVAAWAGLNQQEDVYGILTDILWRSTDVEIRQAVSALSVAATPDEIISEAQALAVWVE